MATYTTLIDQAQYKPRELLGHPNDQVEGNQQPSLNNKEEGSETIRKEYT